DGNGGSDTATVSVTVTSVNDSPIANAGPDQTYEDSGGNGSEQVALDGSGSSDPDNNIADFLWTWQAQEHDYSIGGETPEITLPVSATPYTITLTVTDSDGLTDTDTVAITVNGADPTGSLTVTISQPDTAQWRVDGGSLQNSGATVSGLSVGSHTVEFNSVTSWDTPDAQTIDIANGQTTQAEGDYTQQTGSLRITIEPYAAVSDGAQWRVNDDDWRESEAIVSNLAVGSCAIEFQAIDGWATPDKTVEILNNQLVNEIVSYTPGEDNIASTDKSPPVVTDCSPAPGDIQALLNTRLILHIVDSGMGVDPSSVQILVNSNLVYDGKTNEGDTDKYVSEYGQCRRRGTSADYIYTYDPVKLYEYDQLVTVTVIASDLAGNAMTQSIDYETAMSTMMGGDVPVKLNTTEGCTYCFKTQMRIFGGDVRVGPDLTGVPQDNPVTVQDGQGNIWVAWETGPDGSRDIYVAKKPAGAGYFENNIQITDEPHDQSNPTLTVDDSGTLYLAWQDNRRGNWDIYFSSSLDGSHWSAAVLVTDSDASQTVPAIAVDHQLPPRVYIAWQD
ncbi:MAG: hypothetical protein KAI25_05575, partial [Hyphomicrobiaceae bacterium]|nr:hypothetical protein [Hyphomicrobiaceae bacterium]